MGGGAEDAPKDINGIKLIARRVDGVSGKDLAPLAALLAARLAKRIAEIEAAGAGRARKIATA